MMDDLLVFLCGLIIGSFLNVCIYRLPLNQSIVYPPSHCMKCSHRLKAVDLIPVVSFLILQGRCRYCGERISLRYLAVEMLTGGLFLLCYQAVGFTSDFVECVIVTAFLIVITFIDLDYQLILDKVLFVLAGTIIIMHIGVQYFQISLHSFSLAELFKSIYVFDYLMGFLLGGGLLLFIAVVSRGGMGGGDIKFTAVMGLFLGWKLILVSLFIAFILGGLTGTVLLLLRKKGRKDMIPFGPFLAAGMFIGMLYGLEILGWYLNLY